MVDRALAVAALAVAIFFICRRRGAGMRHVSCEANKPPAAVQATACGLPGRWERRFENGPAMAAAFLEHGVVVLRGFIGPGDVADHLDSISSLIMSLPQREGLGQFPKEHIMYDDVSRPGTLKQIQQLADKCDPIATLIRERLMPVATALLGEPAVLKNVQYFDKPPTQLYAEGDGSKGTPAHQDAHYFMIEPPHTAVTMWLALDEADLENGCLRYEATLADKVRPHRFSDVMGFSQTLVEYSAAGGPLEVAVPAMPGDLICHHSRMVHRAGPNTTATRHRRALGAIFYGASSCVDEAAHAQRAAEIRQRAMQLEGQQGCTVAHGNSLP